MSNETQETMRMLTILLDLNKTIVKEQYRELLLKAYRPKKPEQHPPFIYLN